jgi:plastocyanin
MSKNHKQGSVAFPIIIVLALIVGGILLFTKDTEVSPEVGRIASISLSEQNNSGQVGTALIEEVGETTKVSITLSGGEGAQPVHIHEGTCDALGAVHIALNDIVNGKSETILQESFDFVTKKENSTTTLAINVHKSEEDHSEYVACGVISLSMETTPSDTMEEEEVAPINSETEEEIQEVVIEYSDEGFAPQKIEITKGTRVTFMDKSSRDMWVATDPHPANVGYPGSDRENCGQEGDSFMFDQCGKGESYSFTFMEIGTWNYHNHLRSGDKGTIVVK